MRRRERHIAERRDDVGIVPYGKRNGGRVGNATMRFAYAHFRRASPTGTKRAQKRKTPQAKPESNEPRTGDCFVGFAVPHTAFLQLLHDSEEPCSFLRCKLSRGSAACIYWQRNGVRFTARSLSDRNEQTNNLKKYLFFCVSDTQDVVQRVWAAYYSGKITIYKRVRLMYNKVTVKSGVVALEGTGIGMLS